jgi:hypothetical protein
MTRRQTKEVRATLNELLFGIFQDNIEREGVIDYILDDVIADIDETADWSDLRYDEVNESDIQIALARVLKDAVESKYDSNNE